MSTHLRSRAPLRALFLSIAALAAAGCPARAPEGSRAVDVQRGRIDVSIEATGTLKARNSTRIHSELGRESKIIYLAAEGALVKKDEVLVRLDPTEIQREVESVERDLTAAQAHLDTARTELQIQESEGRNQIKKAELSLKQSQQDLKKHKEGDAPIQENKLKIATEEARSEQERARSKYEQMPTLREKGFVTASQEEEERIRWEKSKVTYESALKELELYRTYTMPMDLARKEEAVDQAASDLQAVKLRSESELKQRQAAKVQAENSLKNAERQLKDLKESLEKSELKAPTDGLVIYGEAGERGWRGDEEIKIGSRVWPHRTIITLPDLSEMEVVLRIHESDIRKIKMDMEVKAVVESMSESVLRGRITKIADLANTGDWREDSSVKMFEIEARLDGKNLGLKPGTTARVEIPIVQKDGILRIPSAGVHGEPGKFYCFAMGQGGPQRRELALGISNDAFAEVVSGLTEGDRVLLGSPPDGAAEQAPAGGQQGKAPAVR